MTTLSTHRMYSTNEDDGPLVFKIGGTTLEEQSSTPDLWRAVVELAQKHPTGVVLLHGGGKAVDRHLARLNLTTQRREGIRITPPEHMNEIVSILAGSVNKGLVAAINAVGGRAVGVCLGDGGPGGAVPTAKTTRFRFDPGSVGDVLPGPGGELLRVLLREKYLPVVSSIGIDSRGTFLNVNADDAAAGVAAAIRASSLVLLTDVPGVLSKSGALIPSVTPEEIEALIDDETIRGGMIPKARAAAQAARDLDAPVVILSGNDPAAFERYVRGGEAGTRIVTTR
ncbi:MAG: acetylglutamate kinase [Phycisphaerae bacterium]|nr:acetylglutamate kinase [Phycisphaerae bacterium]